ncbi:MAG: hypothetical protein QM572_14245, partial [Nocardioides sp.]|uniref:hypothetical protein n=1 Tax=Nocardioides sp. TaxID=35761 RepID=UPI0039E579FD
QARRPRPGLRGSARVGHVLHAHGRRHDPGVRVAFQWLVNGRPVAGATGRAFRLRPAYRGRTVRVRTVATKPGYAPVTRFSRRLRVR